MFLPFAHNTHIFFLLVFLLTPLNSDYTNAEKYIENALYYAEEYNLEYRKARNLFLRANIYKEKKELVLAQQLYLSANVIFIKRNNYEQIINTFLNLGKITSMLYHILLYFELVQIFV